MKKLLSLFAILVVTSACFVFADGFKGGLTAKVTVAEALKLRDDSYVTIQGHIVKRLTEDEYLFKDSTGTIVVDIDQYKWMGLTVDEKDTLELTGEIDKNLTSTKLDVSVVKKIK